MSVINLNTKNPRWDSFVKNGASCDLTDIVAIGLDPDGAYHMIVSVDDEVLLLKLLSMLRIQCDAMTEAVLLGDDE